MDRYYKLGKVYVEFQLATVRKAWIDNDIRKGFLIGLNKYIDITTTISSSTLTYKVTSKPVITSSHNYGLIPKYLNSKYNECNENSIKIKVPINKMILGEVGYKFENTLKSWYIRRMCNGNFKGCKE